MLIFISFCICRGPRVSGLLVARNGEVRSASVALSTPAPTNSLGKQESLDWTAVKKKRGGHKGYGVACFVSFCEPDLISWNLNRLSYSISIICLLRGSRGSGRAESGDKGTSTSNAFLLRLKCNVTT